MALWASASLQDWSKFIVADAVRFRFWIQLNIANSFVWAAKNVGVELTYVRLCPIMQHSAARHIFFFFKYKSQSYSGWCFFPLSIVIACSAFKCVYFLRMLISFLRSHRGSFFFDI